MDSTPRNESISEILPKALAEYIKANVPGIKETYDEFPEASRKVTYPSVSVFTTAPEFRPAMPYTIEVPPANIDLNNKALVKWVVGFWDVRIQLDLWAQNKEQRDDIFDALFNALNPRINPMGLVLTLNEYFNQLCSYDFVGYTLQDAEERAQRDEWRVTLNVLATCKAIRERKEYMITDPMIAPEIEAVGQIDTTVVVDD